MWLDPVALAWSSWLGLATGVVGCFISVVGLVLTYRQAKRAASAASLAREEVARAIALIRSRARFAAVSSAVSRADLLMKRIQQDALASSPEILTEFRRLTREAVGGRPEGIDDALDVKLSELSVLASSRIDRETRKTKMVLIFEEVRTQLIALEARARMEIDP